MQEWERNREDERSVRMVDESIARGVISCAFHNYACVTYIARSARPARRAPFRAQLPGRLCFRWGGSTDCRRPARGKKVPMTGNVVSATCSISITTTTRYPPSTTHHSSPPPLLLVKIYSRWTTREHPLRPLPAVTRGTRVARNTPVNLPSTTNARLMYSRGVGMAGRWGILVGGARSAGRWGL